LQFTKLRLTGFKSFVDPTELVIEPGITGVVGPNGCGKSNLFEALRWVMGETSAKRMRGSEMDDVIFGGTSERPPRNIAEVVLSLDNGKRTAPAAFNHHDELEVSRRIERGSGSDYRINGKGVRARDVQLLFQDHGSGAHSPALVSQGRVAALISAKATDRRLLLEEAAGIMGLHSRRHEAELKLKAAEENLVRLEDVIQAMEGQLGGLKKQARQAARYRALSDRIREAEAVVLHLRLIEAQKKLAAARQAHQANEEVVREHMLAVTRATTAAAEAGEAVEPLRRREAEAAAALQRLTIARDRLADEEKRIEAERAEGERRLAQLTGDIEREKDLAADAEAALERLALERGRLEASRAGEGEAWQQADAALAEAKAAVEDLERELEARTERVAADEAARDQLERRIRELEEALGKTSRRLEAATAERAAMERQIAESPDVAEAEAAVAAADRALADARHAAEAAEDRRQAAEDRRQASGETEREARDAAQTAEAALARLKAEADGLLAALGSGRPKGQTWPPILDSVAVAKGYEAAFGAALGDDAEAPADAAAPIHWRALPPLYGEVGWPEGVEPLPDRVDAPAELARRLSHIGVVADEAAGEGLAARLAPGQMLVGRDGAVWRWDGLVKRAGAPSAAAARLQQRNRLAELEGEIEAAQASAGEARAGVDRARAAREAAARDADVATTAAKEARRGVDQAYAGADRARGRHAELERQAAARQSKYAGLVETAERLAQEREEAVAAVEAARAARADLPDTAEQRAAIAELRGRLAEARSVQGDRQNALDRLTREARQRSDRLITLEDEVRGWQSRASGAGERLAELESRAGGERERLEALAGRPAEIEAQRSVLLDRIAEAERNRRTAADALAGAEATARDTARVLKEAESALAAAREKRVRAEAEVEAAMTAVQAVRERIEERLEVAPEKVGQLAGLAPGDALPDLAATEQKLERLLRERETMGPVNLRAETEANELDQQIQGMHAEREDLIAAIARLRQGIGSLNKEARERLLGAFDVVDGHFQRLFGRLFGGGKAYLKLTEAEDPLNAGLEIFASPPGKRLQHLSLLSGGEQALTAVAVLFAVFLTNPAPICVLDEVDAPLDDANVDRFCSLLEELSDTNTTRFLLVTHHRMTMARAHRLYGVTMTERGVSKLVSVDLQQAEHLRETA